LLHELTSYDGSEFVQFNKEFVINASIVQKLTLTILKFTVPLEALSQNPISMKEPTLFVWTVGSSNIILKKKDSLQMKAKSTRWVVHQSKEEALLLQVLRKIIGFFGSWQSGHSGRKFS
jgi:hypothetical protein